MSFITKRERVFNEYELVDLPPRNEGRLKAYASCTDARAWSHFCSAKSEHLTEIIKRNNDLGVSPKYVPTKVIVDTIMVTKNLEIARLKRKIGEFEQMLAVYDELDLDSDQKCEIAKAHAIIKAENKNLDDMCLHLNISGFTDAMDSDGFETGKSRGDVSLMSKGGESDRSHGDEWTFNRELLTKANQTGMECPCDASVSAHDPRIEEMQEEIISKDAKLNAMRNTLAIMENDVCEPYGIYAHIYTALEKIYGILSQNSKYKQYLNLMTAGKDTRCIDIKGKILFKLKVLEKFCLALIAPCSKNFNNADAPDCSCYRAEVVTRVDKLALKPAETTNEGFDGKRSQLVADIMDHEEMKEILSKDNNSAIDELLDDFDQLIDTRYDINEENQKRIKDLQNSYEELMNCYENLKHDNDCLRAKCSRYEELEAEVEYLRGQLREYGALWNEKEHYRKRSEDLDSLKEQFIVLAEESSGLETKLKAEAEINQMKTSTIDDLRSQNIDLEKRLSDFHVNLELERNALECKLQESECKVQIQEQQIKSLKAQIMQLLEHQSDTQHLQEESPLTAALMDENETLKRQISNFQDIEADYQDKLSLLNELKGEIEVWKDSYDKAQERNIYLEKCLDSQRDERNKLLDDNERLLQTLHDKTNAIDNLMQIINSKSQEINNLIDTNQDVKQELENVKEKYDGEISKLQSEKTLALSNLQVSRQESQELLQRVKDYNDFVEKQEDLSNTIDMKMQEYESMKKVLKYKIEENEKLKRDLDFLQNKDRENEKTLELTKTESRMLEQKLADLENVSQQFMKLRDDYDKLIAERNALEQELKQKVLQLDSAIYSVKLNKRESSELLKQSEAIKEELQKLNTSNQRLTASNSLLQENLDHLREQNEILIRKIAKLSALEQDLADLKDNYNDLVKEKRELQHEFKAKNDEVNNLYNTLENKIEENRILQDKIKNLQVHNLEATSSIRSLENENTQKETALKAARRQSSVLIEKLQNHESLESEYNKLKTAHEQITLEKERLQRSLNAQLADLKRLERENFELNGQTNNLLTHNSKLEEALISTRNQLLSNNSSPDSKPYADMMKEIQNMNEEKLAGRKRIRELMDTLDVSENYLANLKEQLYARDDKIAIMQNHINELEDEVQRLHEILDEAVATSGDIKETTHKKLDQTMQQMEAHHSKATHNIKMELAMLQNTHAKLEDQLSMTQLQNMESSNDKQQQISQINQLKNDREIIVTDIKQLELGIVGDSELMPDNCKIEQILAALDRIRTSFEVRESKYATLEQTLQKVQTSSQLFLSKADDAKKYLEKEKQKILAEKEDAIKEKLDLEKEIARDKTIINDLEREILNQKLIYEKIKESSEIYVSKLKDEMNSLEDLYQNSISKVRELQEKLNSSISDTNTKELIIQKLNDDLQRKSKEIAELQAQITEWKKKHSNNNIAVQATTYQDKKHIHSQTDKSLKSDQSNQTEVEQKKSANSLSLDINMTAKNKYHAKESNLHATELLPQQKPPSINEVHILAAKVEPTFDFDKSSYLNYKMQRLGTSQLQHHSFPHDGESGQSHAEDSPDTSNLLANHSDDNPNKSEESYLINRNKSSSNLIDIYNGPSNDTNKSSKIMTYKHDSFSLGPTNDSFRTESIGNIQSIENEINTFFGTSDKSKEKDVLVIFKENESSFNGKTFKEEDHTKDDQLPNHGKNYDNYGTDTFYLEDEEGRLKRKLEIDLPRVDITDYDKKSLDSLNESSNNLSRRNNLSDTKIMINAPTKDIGKYETPSLPTVSNDGNVYDDSQYTSQIPSGSTHTPDKKGRKKVEKKSLDKLSRVGAGVYLMKTMADRQKEGEGNVSQGKQIALEYILDSVKQVGDDISAYSPVNSFPKSGHDDIPGDAIIIQTGESSPTGEFSMIPIRSHTVSVERSVMVKMDESAEYYESVIKNLKNTLDNVEKDYKKKMEAIKIQYDRNISSIINEHNQGVKNIQSLHEETLQDIMRIHENEVDNLRSMSMEAMRKADKLEKENMCLKIKIRDESPPALEEVPCQPCSPRRKLKMRHSTKCLSKTTIESFNVKPKIRLHGPCTCSLDVNISDTIRNIFEQVDVEQRKLAEIAYLKYIIGKISNGNIEGLDAQELSFLHLKVCRTWKSKLTKEEALQKKIDSLEVELINKQRNAQQHMAELDRKVAEEKRRLEEVREAVCRNSPEPRLPPAEKDLRCVCGTISEDRLQERRSAGDLTAAVPPLRAKRTRNERAVLARMDADERRERRLYTDEPPTRLRRQNERPSRASKK